MGQSYKSIETLRRRKINAKNTDSTSNKTGLQPVSRPVEQILGFLGIFLRFRGNFNGDLMAVSLVS